MNRPTVNNKRSPFEWRTATEGSQPLERLSSPEEHVNVCLTSFGCTGAGGGFIRRPGRGWVSR
jgi:hypothetical protein